MSLTHPDAGTDIEDLGDHDTDLAATGTSITPITIDPEDYVTPEVPPHRTMLMSRVSWSLVIVLLIAGGFYAGVWVQRRETPASTSASGAGALRAFAARAGATGSTGAGATGAAATGSGGAGAGAGGTRGTVVLVDAANHAVYIQDATGTAIKVIVGPSTAMSVNTTTADPNDYAVGATLTVQGTANPDGSITATAISPAAARTGGNGAASGGTATGATATTTAGGSDGGAPAGSVPATTAAGG